MIVTDREIYNPTIPDLPSRDLVTKLCRQKGLDFNNLTYTTANGKILFIKYNNAKMAEAHAHLFYSRIRADSNSTIRISELYHAWVPEHSSSAHIVMEYIDIHHFASDEERARTLTKLIAIEPPPGIYRSFGPPGVGVYIRHMFFKDREAARIYTSVQELQDFINRILQFIHSSTGQGHGTVDFSDEPLTCCYGDICRENFPVDQCGNLWDFDITGVLPASFAAWPLDTKYKRPLPIPIRKTIPLETSKNLKAMFRAYGFNQMSVG
ncbi:hypothetical protein BDW69DRAFT_181140 [Aspergillus filifer]